jgi:selenocysteine lyase/cysteine desulfurase
MEVGIETARDRARALAGYTRDRLAALDGVRVLDRGRELCAIVTADVGRDGPEVKLELRRRGINTSSPEREDAVIDMDAKGSRSAIRISPHYYNTAEEVDRAIEVLADVLRESTGLRAPAPAPSTHSPR